jgi:tRNA-2-methylthio-N6-dimethylallyladenosine synthase
MSLGLMSHKKIYIKTYGCQMNVYDSDRMEDLMTNVGYQQTQDATQADVVIINTCHIREKAAEKLYSDLGRIKKHKDKKAQNDEQMIVVVAGCVGQAEGKEIFKRAPVVDVIVGPESYQSLPDLIGKAIRDKSKEIDLDFKPENKFDILSESKSKTKVSNFVSVQEGCDKFCAFCVVPYTRGAEFSRPVVQILREIENLVQRGTKEIYLLGQNVNAYHGENYDGKIFNLAKLIKKIALIDGVERIRYTTSHPIDMDQELIEAHGEVKKLMPFLHLPIQSGSNNILKKMNRKHTRQQYFKIIEDLRNYRPDIGLSSDFIVGFPGESDKDFADTMDLVKSIGFSQCYSFKYSPRPGTPATSAEQIPEEVKEVRLAELQKLLFEQQFEFNKKFEGKEFPVLFDKFSNKNKNQVIGKSPWLQSVVVDNPEIINHTNQVRVVKSRPSSLIAELIDS